MPHRIVAVTAVALLVLTATAQAQDPIVQRSLEIADRWAAKEAPHIPNHCAGGNMSLTFSANPLVDGVKVHAFADGYNGHVWDHTRCIATIRTGVTPYETCQAIAHELMHYVLGPGHTGPLAPNHPGPTECLSLEPREPTCRKYRKVWRQRGGKLRRIWTKAKPCRYARS